MELFFFIQTLLTQGKVSVQGKLISFDEQDSVETTELLRQFYKDDILEMPFAAPEFSADAALWAAQYFYKAVQLTVLRDVSEEDLSKTLQPFSEPSTAEHTYSADLVLRYLPELFELTKGLAPADVLVLELLKTAQQWPFSSVGIELKEPTNEAIIFTNPSLKYAYIDKIIQQRDKQRIGNAAIITCINEVAGEQINLLWPGFDNAITKVNRNDNRETTGAN